MEGAKDKGAKRGGKRWNTIYARTHTRTVTQSHNHTNTQSHNNKITQAKQIRINL